MTIRLKLALVVLVMGLFSAVAIIATVLAAFNSFEDEVALRRANVFLDRVLLNYDNLLDIYDSNPGDFDGMMQSLVLYQPDLQLYVLNAKGTVLSVAGGVAAGQAEAGVSAAAVLGSTLDLAAVRQVLATNATQSPDLVPVLHSQSHSRAAARNLYRKKIRHDNNAMGYLYLKIRPVGARATTHQLGPIFGNVLAVPALVAIALTLLLATLATLWLVAVVIRPLRDLTATANQVARDGLDGFKTPPLRPNLHVKSPRIGTPPRTQDEFAALRSAFGLMGEALARQWSTLQQLDRFRREGVSNLSHDLRSPLTATEACLETLESQLGPQRSGTSNGFANAASADKLHLVQLALRNARDASRLVRSLGDLASLDEPTYPLHCELLDAHDLLDSIAMRFSGEAARKGLHIRMAAPEPDADGVSRQAVLWVDVALLERAISNLIDNAMKFVKPGGEIVLSASGAQAPKGDGTEKQEPASALGLYTRVSVNDNGTGIIAADLPLLFDRFYQSRSSVQPASSPGGKGLGLAIVKRIAELHHGLVRIDSAPGEGTCVQLFLPAAAPESSRA